MDQEEVNRIAAEQWNERATDQATAMRYILDGYHEDYAAFLNHGKANLGDIEDALHAVGLRWPEGGIGVEIGCGIGRISYWAAQRLTKLFACDVSRNMVKNAIRHPNIEYVVTGSLYWNAFPPVVDIIYSHLVMQHMPKSSFWHYLSDASYLLRPGGVFIAQMNAGVVPLDFPAEETLLCRAYTAEELEQSLDRRRWHVKGVLYVAGTSERFRWLTLVRKDRE